MPAKDPPPEGELPYKRRRVEGESIHSIKGLNMINNG
jgi:hypothetical protein